MKSSNQARRRHRIHRGPAERKRTAQGAAAVECELKFGVPDEAWDPLVRELSGPDTRLLPLHAVYQDVPGGALARAAIALRVRREPAGWIQTLKTPGVHSLGRLEDEVALGGGDDATPPKADLQRHTLPTAQAVLRTALGLGKAEPLPAVLPVFEVKVQRRTRRIMQGRSVIEVALDEGHVQANGRRRTVRELELELVDGNVRDLLAMARKWRERWGLWLSTASKAARGDRLAQGDLYGPPVGAVPPALPGKPRMGPFTAAVLDACLAQVMGNASEVAAGSQADDHVHQVRVGLRRLRTALRELPTLAGDRKRFEPVLVNVFRGLGERRDRTHVLRTIAPLVEAAGGRPLRVPAGFHDGADPGALVRGADFQDALLRLLDRAEELRRQEGEPVRRTLREHLKRLHKQVTREGRRFTRLSQDSQHGVRKRLKRLRYLGEFAAPLFPSKAVERYLACLKPAQDALGQYNDEIMAEELYEELVGADPGARFGAEWLRSRRSGEASKCGKSLRKLEKARPFWKKR